jgi:hypothetical protein
MSRWVCLRCFESNDEGSHACSKCGLLRGATPAEGEAAWVAPAEAPPARGPATNVLGILLRYWWVIAIVVVGVGGFIFNAQRDSDGQITNSGNLQVTDLRVGDCFDLKDRDAELLEEVTARPCSEGHEYELYFRGNLPAGAFPAEDTIITWLGDNCLPAFDAYVGMTYAESRYDFSWFEPTEEGWADGDHEVSCAVFDPAQPVLTTTVRNSAQ